MVLWQAPGAGSWARILGRDSVAGSWCAPAHDPEQDPEQDFGQDVDQDRWTLHWGWGLKHDPGVAFWAL